MQFRDKVPDKLREGNVKALSFLLSKPLPHFISNFFKAQMVVIEIPGSDGIKRAFMITGKGNALCTCSEGTVEVNMWVPIRRRNVSQ
jgi:hypothetical protein